MRSIEKTGKKPEDAINAGLKELGCDLSDVTIDILDAGSPGLFGMFGRLARVRLTVKEDDDFNFDFDFSAHGESEKPEKPEKSAKPARADKPERPARADKAEKPTASDKPDKPEKPEKPDKPEKSEKPARADKPERPARAESAEKNEKPARSAHADAEDEAIDKGPVRHSRSRGERRSAAPEKPFEPTDPATLEGEALMAYDFLSNITKLMGVSVQIQVTPSKDQLNVSMMGDTLGILIGRRGETLDALQYLTSLVVNRQRDAYMRVSLDTENYRAKREEALSRLAQRMAARARKTGRKVTMEPMNPYERRVLHSALQNNPYVTTHSEGEEPYRRVIITLKDEEEA